MSLLRKSIPSSARLVGFAAAMEHRNFTHAASALGMTQAAISRQIRELEDEIGVRLFERKARDVVPTNAALRLADAVLPALQAIGGAVEDVRLDAKQQNLLTIYTDHSLANSFVLPKASAFEARHPSVKVLILSSNAAVEGTVEKYDLVVQHGFPTNKAFTSQQIASETIFPVGAPEIAAQLPSQVSLEDLADAPLLEFSQPGKKWVDWRRFFSRFGLNVSVTPRARFDSYLGAVDAALSGQGLLLGWEIPILNHLEREVLVRVGAWDLQENGGLRVYRRKNHQGSTMVDKLEEWLLSH